MTANPAQFVSAAEITRNFGMWQDRAAHGPLIVTHHGRPRVAILSADDYDALRIDDASSSGATGAGAELSILLDHIPSPFAAFDDQLSFRRLNAAARAYWGLSDQDLIGRPLTHAFPQLDEGLIQAQLRRVLRSREDASFDAPSHLYPDRMLRFRAFAYAGGVATVFNDVGNEVDNERDAARRIGLAKANDAHGGVGVARLTVRGTFDDVGGALAALAGFEGSKLLGVRFADVLALKRRGELAEELEAVLTGAGPRAFDSDLLVNGGGELPVHVALAETREGFAVTGAMLLLTVRH